MEKLVLCGSAAIKNNSCTNGLACASDIDVAGRIRTLIKQNNQTGVVAFLSCIDEVWAYRLLVTTLIDQGKYSQALTNLLRIPDNTPDNIEFKAMCNAIIANLQAGTNIGGRQNTQALQQLRTIAQARQSTQTALAQSNLALLQGDSYVRSSVAIEDEKGTNTIAVFTEKLFSIVPNPATSYCQFIWQNNAPLPANTQCYIYSFDGSVVKTVAINAIVNTISLQDLHSGMYYCRLNNGQQVEKLIIVK